MDSGEEVGGRGGWGAGLYPNRRAGDTNLMLAVNIVKEEKGWQLLGLSSSELGVISIGNELAAVSLCLLSFVFCLLSFVFCL